MPFNTDTATAAAAPLMHCLAKQIAPVFILFFAKTGQTTIC